MTEIRTLVARRIGAPPWPREQGAWVMLFLPMALCCAVAESCNGAALWISAALLLFFLLRAATVPSLARTRQRRSLPHALFVQRMAWGFLYVAAALACVVVAFHGSSTEARSAMTWALLPPVGLGLFHTALGVAGSDRTLWGEIVGMVGLASTAPLVAAAAGSGPDRRSWGAAALALAYFLSTLAFVRAYRKRKTAGRIDVSSCVWAHAGISAALVLLWAAGALPAVTLASFVPVLARTVWGLARPPRDLRALGFREVAVATAFMSAAIAAFIV